MSISLSCAPMHSVSVTARLRALRCAEARHRDANYIFLRQREQVERPVRDKQGKRRIESARYAYNRFFEPDMLYSLCEPRRLDIEYLGAACASDLFVGGHEWVRVKGSVYIALLELGQGYFNAPYIAVGVAHRIVIKFAVSAQGLELFDIDAGTYHRTVSLKAFVLREYAAVFGYRACAGKYEIGRARRCRRRNRHSRSSTAHSSAR